MAFEYAAKFIYGKSAGDVAAFGFYYTTINVHNPAKTAIGFKKKVAVALPAEKPGPVSKFVDWKLGADQALEIDGPDIGTILKKSDIALTSFATGFVVIQCESELDVVAVYTVADTKEGPARAMHMERGPARRF